MSESIVYENYGLHFSKKSRVEIDSTIYTNGCINYSDRKIKNYCEQFERPYLSIEDEAQINLGSKDLNNGVQELSEEGAYEIYDLLGRREKTFDGITEYNQWIFQNKMQINATQIKVLVVLKFNKIVYSKLILMP